MSLSTHMKILATCALLALAGATVAQAQKTPTVLTVDFNAVYQGFERAQEAQSKFQSAVENAQTEIQDELDKRQSIVDEISDLDEKLASPAVSDARKDELRDAIASKREELQSIEGEIVEFRDKTRTFLQDRARSIRQLHANEIIEMVREIAEEKNADLVLNSSGVGAVVYAAESFDITEICLERLNAEDAGDAE